jgi:hypothetical protein
MKKETIKDIVNHVIDYGYDDGTCELHLSTDGTWEVVHIAGESESVNYTDTGIEIPIPDYEDEPFVEDKKAAFTLDLMQIISEWERHLEHASRLKKTHDTLRKKDPDFWKKIASKKRK